MYTNKLYLHNIIYCVGSNVNFVIIVYFYVCCSIFLSAVERCLAQPHELGKLFKKYERKLLMYVVYCQNKPVSEYLVSEHDYYFEVKFS